MEETDLTTKELAERLDVSVSSIRRYKKAGMPARQLMKDCIVTFDPAAVQKWLAEEQKRRISRKDKRHGKATGDRRSG